MSTEPIPEHQEEGPQTMEEHSLLRQLFSISASKLGAIMDATGQSRNKYMALGSLKNAQKIPVSVLGSPYKANRKEGANSIYKRYFAGLISNLTGHLMSQVEHEARKSELDPEWIRTHFMQQMEANIAENYRYIREKYNIFSPFATKNNPVHMTLGELQDIVHEIYTNPETGMNAFIKDKLPSLPIVKVEESYISTLLLEEGGTEEVEDEVDDEDIKEKKKRSFGMLSSTELSSKLNNANVDSHSIPGILQEYDEQIEQWDMEFFRRIGIFGPPEKTAHMEIQDFTARWNNALTHVLQEAIGPIEGFIRKLIHLYNINAPFSLEMRNELLNASPLEMLSYIEKENANPKLASLAQTVLTLTMEYILTEEHPDYKNATRVNFQLDHMAPHDGTYSYIRWDMAKKMWALDPKVHGTGWTHVEDDEGKSHWLVPPTKVNGNGNGNDMVNHTDDTTLGSESMDRLASIIDGNTDTTPKKLEWRCWMDPNNKRKTPVEYPLIDPMTGENKQVKFYLAGRGMKGIMAILSKLHTRKWSFDEIYDLVRSRLVLNISKEEIETPEHAKAVSSILHELSHDLAQSMYRLVHVMNIEDIREVERSGETLEMKPNSYFVENDFDEDTPEVQDEEMPKVVQKNGISSRLWKVFKIIGRSKHNAPLEAQLVPHDVYCLDLSEDSPVSHGWYEVDRYLDFIQSILPVIYFSKDHKTFNDIRKARQFDKEKRTRKWEKNLGLAEGTIAA